MSVTVDPQTSVISERTAEGLQPFAAHGLVIVKGLPKVCMVWPMDAKLDILHY